jgi:hypothetical protein
MPATPSTPEELFAGEPVGLLVLDRVQEALAGVTAEIRTTRSQVAFRRARAFAWVWPPGRYVRSTAPAVVSFALPGRLSSPRIKQVVEPRPGTWMHHVEVRSPDEVDGELVGWLRAAAGAAA